jgi:hypothetical protein
MANTKSLSLTRSSSQHAAITDASQTNLDFTTDWSIEAWLKIAQLPSSASDFFTIAGKHDGDANSSNGYFFRLNSSDTIAAYFGNGSGGLTLAYATTALTSADVDEWIHLAVTADISASTLVFYKNGSALTTAYNFQTATTLNDNSKPFSIGTTGVSGSFGRYYDGLLDEIIVWNDIRTGTEISESYNSGNGKEYVGNEAGMVGYWRLEDNYLDLTANDNDLTAYNSPTFSTDVPFGGGAPTTALVDMLGGIIPFAR